MYQKNEAYVGSFRRTVACTQFSEFRIACEKNEAAQNDERHTPLIAD
jgi:hypothetical protein